MYQEEKTFVLRFSLEASFPEDYEGEDDPWPGFKNGSLRSSPACLKQIFRVVAPASGLDVACS